MVTEKGGIIRHYDMVSGQLILSLDCYNTPVTSADWSHCDSALVGAVAGSSWFLWDISQSRSSICYTIYVEILAELIFGVLSNNCIWQYINLVKFKVLLYNLQCSLRDWWNFNLASSEKSPNFNPSQNFYSYSM